MYGDVNQVTLNTSFQAQDKMQLYNYVPTKIKKNEKKKIIRFRTYDAKFINLFWVESNMFANL